MARPRKTALDYYPIDVDFLRQFPVRLIMKKCGAESPAVMLSLLGRIYGIQGYYLQWTKENAFFIGEDSYVDAAKVQEVVKEALEINFFDKKMLTEHQILTSKEIQEQYFTIVKQSRRKIQYNPAYLLVDKELISPAKRQVSPEETPVSTEETGVNTGNNGININESGISAEGIEDSSAQTPQSKQNKTKINETKKDETKQKNTVDCYPQNYPQINVGILPDCPQTVVKEDLRRVGFTNERDLAQLMRAIDEQGITKQEFEEYVKKSKDPAIKKPLGFITQAIRYHYFC
ncbi:DUF4373 domain-containing protein [Acidaminococcus fermentans]|uniref:DUF4373 domain-containing protein n=1 Tax=Acidaminococcus fermentans TaxID=905 RepID=UPI002432F306|nr:DUF4373 domain-containing protein [Acidaminococcus fermentans]MDD6287136.1 DUF4373 domain-containing protein [Acidaminococcus fermentans]